MYKLKLFDYLKGCLLFRKRKQNKTLPSDGSISPCIISLSNYVDVYAFSQNKSWSSPLTFFFFFFCQIQIHTCCQCTRHNLKTQTKAKVIVDPIHFLLNLININDQTESDCISALVLLNARRGMFVIYV